MNTMRMLGVAVVCLIGGVAMAEEKKGDYTKLIVGKWEVTKADEGTVPTGTMIEFTKDGKMLFVAKMGDQEIKLEGTYKVDGSAFKMTTKFGEEEKTQVITIKSLDDKTLSTADKDGKAVVLTRKK